MKNIFSIAIIMSIILLFKCSPEYHVNERVVKPEYKDYISCFFMGEVGTLPAGCEINTVEMTGDSVLVCGKVFDKDTEKTSKFDIWIGAFVEKTYDNGYTDFLPLKRKPLLTTDIDGIFCVKFEIHKNDVLCMDQIGYDPAIFEIYHYLQDFNLIE
jgi:hypothetical protein